MMYLYIAAAGGRHESHKSWSFWLVYASATIASVSISESRRSMSWVNNFTGVVQSSRRFSLGGLSCSFVVEFGRLLDSGVFASSGRWNDSMNCWITDFISTRNSWRSLVASSVCANLASIASFARVSISAHLWALSCSISARWSAIIWFNLMVACVAWVCSALNLIISSCWNVSTSVSSLVAVNHAGGLWSFVGACFLAPCGGGAVRLDYFE